MKVFQIFHQGVRTFSPRIRIAPWRYTFHLGVAADAAAAAKSHQSCLILCDATDGSPPSSARVQPRLDPGIRSMDGVGNQIRLFIQRQKERLGKNSVVEKIKEKRGCIPWFTQETNKAPRQGTCTIYIGHRLLFEQWRVPRLGLSLTWVLEAWENKQTQQASVLQMGNSLKRRERKEDTGETSLPRNWTISLFFRKAFIL